MNEGRHDAEPPEGGPQKMLDSQANSKTSTSFSEDHHDSSDSTQRPITEGVVISASASTKQGPHSESEHPFAQGSSDEGNGDGNNHSPVAPSPDIGSVPPAPIHHPFDTNTFVKRLQEAKFTRKTPEKHPDSAEGVSLVVGHRHDPAEAIMEATRHLLVTRGQHLVGSQMNKTEAENQAYLFTAALAELRTELQVRARNDAVALRSMVTLLQREVDGLSQRLREDVAGMKHDIQVDMNNRKNEAKEEQNSLDQEIQDLNNRFTISISDLK